MTDNEIALRVSDAVRIADVLFSAGSQWGQCTPTEILSALDAAGYEIVRKRQTIKIEASVLEGY